jgi:hypothetical protein
MKSVDASNSASNSVREVEKGRERGRRASGAERGGVRVGRHVTFPAGVRWAIVTHLLGEADGPTRDIDRWPQMRAAETVQRRAFNWSELTPTTQAALEGLGVTNQTDMDGLPERSGFHLLLSVSGVRGGEWVQITYSTESL